MPLDADGDTISFVIMSGYSVCILVKSSASMLLTMIDAASITFSQSSPRGMADASGTGRGASRVKD